MRCSNCGSDGAFQVPNSRIALCARCVPQVQAALEDLTATLEMYGLLRRRKKAEEKKAEEAEAQAQGEAG